MPTRLKVTLPDPAVKVEFWTGDHLASRMCTDVPFGEVTDRMTIRAGQLRMFLAPRPGAFRPSRGTVELTDVSIAEGPPLADLTIATRSIGVYDG